MTAAVDAGTVPVGRRSWSIPRLSLSFAGWLVVAAVIVLAWPVQLGGHLGLTVVSGHSMDGTYRTGDLLVTWPHATYGVGGVAVYRVPGDGAGHGMHVVHRITGHAPGGGYVMRGDNKDTPDQWHPTDADVVGRPFARIPGGGLALRWIFNPLALALLCGVCVYFLIAKPATGTAEGTPQRA